MNKVEDPRFKSFLKEYCWNEILQLANEYPDVRSLYIPFQTINLFDRSLSLEVLESPEKTIRGLEESLKEIDLPVDKSLDHAHIRIVNIPSKVAIGNLRSSHLGKFVAIEGMIRKATEVRPRITKAAFQCMRCGYITYVEQNSFKFEEPFAGCEEETCGKKGPFKVLIDESTFIDAQKLQIQEPPEDLRGAQSQGIDIDADDDIAGLVLPGQRIVINGILKSRQRTLKDGKSTYFDIVLEANSIEMLESAYDEVEISSSDEGIIISLSQEHNIYSKMVNSIAPSIKGMDDVKEAMVLQLFSGVPKFLPDGSIIRGDSHILFCGDPSLGKTQLMKSSQARSPRGIFASGKSATAAGLTAAVVKDDKFGEGRWTVEGGALVMADKGIVFIDEADKMKDTDRDALHPAMEQQEINLSKAGIMATLKTRAAVFMAANPKHGKFDRYENLAEQIDLPPSLLSRFDLIFCMLDVPEEKEDAEISIHMLKTHRAGEIRQQRESGNITISSVLANEAEQHLMPDVSPELFKKYVAYSRKNIFPVLTDEAIDQIHTFYMSLRNAAKDSKVNSVPITRRQEEAMVRLAEASARVRLSNEVTLDDAKRATNLMLNCLRTVGLDPKTGEIDSSLFNSGTSLSQRNNAKTIKEILKSLSGKFPGGKIPISDVINEAGKHGIEGDKVEENIKKFAQRGDILKPSPNHVKLV